MENAQKDLQADLDDADTLGRKEARMRSLANLRPAWTSQSAPRQGGRAKDGGGTKDAPFRKLLRAKARKRAELRRLVDTLWETACSIDNPGAAAARRDILARLDPVLDDSAAGRTVLEGMKLELTHRGASLTLARQEGPPLELRELSSTGVPEGGRAAQGVGLVATSVEIKESSPSTESVSSEGGDADQRSASLKMTCSEGLAGQESRGPTGS